VNAEIEKHWSWHVCIVEQLNFLILHSVVRWKETNQSRATDTPLFKNVTNYWKRENMALLHFAWVMNQITSEHILHLKIDNISKGFLVPSTCQMTGVSRPVSTTNKLVASQSIVLRPSHEWYQIKIGQK
jgi:hypothetical protein